MRVLSVVARCGLWIVMVILVFGRRRVWPEVADARRNLSGVCRRWYPVVLILHRFFIAVSRALVDCDDSSGLAPHPLVWSAGGLPKGRRIADVVRDVVLLPGPLHLWDSGWISVPPFAVTAEDVCLWPYSVDILVKLVTFLGSLHWPLVGPGGISYVELLTLYELWAGERLQFEKAVPRCKRVDRPISVSAVPIGAGIDIRRSCEVLGAMLRALCALPGGLGRFLPCAIGTIVGYGTLVGLIKSGQGLTSRPRETSNVRFFDELLFLFGYPPGSGGALLRGTLPLRYCTSRFAHKVPTWCLPFPGGVALLVGLGHGGGMLVRSDPSSPDCGRIGDRSGVSGSGCKRVRLWRKPSLVEEDDDAGGRQLHDHLDFGGPCS